jgi:hypothetical protein
MRHRGKSLTHVLIACSVLSLAAAPSRSGEVIGIACEKESTTTPGWGDVLTANYEGDETGRLIVDAAHTRLELAATKSIRAEDGAVSLLAGGEVAAIMPDLERLDACTAENVPAEFAEDPDFYNVASMGCLETVEMGAEPVAVRASVNIGILSEEDVIVEIRRTYLDPSSGPGGVAYIETYPTGCTVVTGPP